MRLYHYTCVHGAAAIRADGLWLKPNRQPLLAGIPLVWLTDLYPPVRYGLGLTCHSLACDRMAQRFTVEADDDAVTHWPVFAHHLPTSLRRRMDTSPGALPMHWWVATTPLKAVTP